MCLVLLILLSAGNIFCHLLPNVLSRSIYTSTSMGSTVNGSARDKLLNALCHLLTCLGQALNHGGLGPCACAGDSSACIRSTSSTNMESTYQFDTLSSDGVVGGQLATGGLFAAAVLFARLILRVSCMDMDRTRDCAKRLIGRQQTKILA